MYGRADPAVLIIRIRLIFVPTIPPNMNSAFCPLFGAELNTNRIFGTDLLFCNTHSFEHYITITTTSSHQQFKYLTIYTWAEIKTNLSQLLKAVEISKI